MKTYLNPNLNSFIPGRGRVLIVPKGEEPSMHEIILVDFDGTLAQKRVVGLACSTTQKTVGVILRDLDFPSPEYWEDGTDKKVEGGTMKEDKWWPDRRHWPPFYPERIFLQNGEFFDDRLHTDEAMALLLLEGYVFMLNANGYCGLYVNCNDTFYYASADAEPLPLIGFGEDGPFWELYDLVRIYGGLGAIKWSALRRGMVPLETYVREMAEAGLWCEKMEALRVGSKSEA